jgi:hypothetical protein
MLYSAEAYFENLMIEGNKASSRKCFQKKIEFLKNNIKKGLFPAKSSRKVENKSILEAKVD